MNLSILIPTVVGREEQLNRLLKILDDQMIPDIEVLVECDNKEISIGEKRDNLYRKAKGKFSVMIDDDDFVPDNYIEVINAVIDSNPNIDCIGYFEHCTINGKYEKSVISLKNRGWVSHNEMGQTTHLRTPFFKVPILTSICQRVGVRDMRFGEDHDFAIRILPYLKKEHFIYRDMYYYRADSLTQQQHKERYGISN